MQHFGHRTLCFGAQVVPDCFRGFALNRFEVAAYLDGSFTDGVQMLEGLQPFLFIREILLRVCRSLALLENDVLTIVRPVVFARQPRAE